MSKQATRPKVILDGMDISHKVASVKSSGEVGFIVYYSILLIDGTEKLVDSLRCEVIFPEVNK